MAGNICDKTMHLSPACTSLAIAGKKMPIQIQMGCLSVPALDEKSGFFIFLDFICFFFVGFGGGVSEISNGFSHSTAYFRQFPGPKDDKNNDEYDDEFRHSYSKHVRLLLR